MRNTVREWWVGLARRERVATLAAVVLALAALVFLLGIEPAWRTRARLASELPVLRAQAAQVEALRLEARRLKERVVRALRGVDAANCLGALKDMSSELPLRITAARITRVSVGTVDADVTLA